MWDGLVSDGKIRFFGCVMVMLASCCCWLNKLLSGLWNFVFQSSISFLTLCSVGCVTVCVLVRSSCF